MSVTTTYDASFPRFSFGGYTAEIAIVTTTASDTSTTFTPQIIQNVVGVIGAGKWSVSGTTVTVGIPASTGVYHYLVYGY